MFWKTEISGHFCLFNLFVYYMKITVLHLKHSANIQMLNDSNMLPGLALSCLPERL